MAKLNGDYVYPLISSTRREQPAVYFVIWQFSADRKPNNTMTEIQGQGWQMAPRKSWLSEPISKSRTPLHKNKSSCFDIPLKSCYTFLKGVSTTWGVSALTIFPSILY